jgi:hypothetical protein
MSASSQPLSAPLGLRVARFSAVITTGNGSSRSFPTLDETERYARGVVRRNLKMGMHASMEIYALDESNRRRTLAEREGQWLGTVQPANDDRIWFDLTPCGAELI